MFLGSFPSIPIAISTMPAAHRGHGRTPWSYTNTRERGAARGRAFLTSSMLPTARGTRRSSYAQRMTAAPDGESGGDSSPNFDSEAIRDGYSPPAHSEAFLRHLEDVRSSWPYDPEEDGISDTSEEETVHSFTREGVQCTGEPSIDPSRMVQSVVDGEFDWI
ncbi:hypothetical protein ACHAWF_012642 [Thalassiosira exigua]